MVNLIFLDTGKLGVTFENVQDFDQVLGVLKTSPFKYKEKLQMWVGEVRHFFSIEEDLLFWDELNYGENNREDFYDLAFPEYSPDIRRIRYAEDTLKYNPLIPEQKIAINHLLKLDNALLDSDVGTGKTFMSMGAIVTRFKLGDINKIIFLTVPSVMYSFREEVFKFTDYFKEEEVKVILSKDKECFDPNVKMLIMSHDAFRIISTYFHKKITKKTPTKPRVSHLPIEEWTGKDENCMLVIDEAHKIKNPTSLRYKFTKVAAPLFKYKVAMSGTLAPRAFSDFWAYTSILDPACFYSLPFTEWKLDTYEADTTYSDYGIGDIRQDRKDLYLERLRVLSYSLSKKLLNLPGEIQKSIMIPMGPKLSKLYQSITQDKFSKIIDSPDGLTTQNVDNAFWYAKALMADPLLLQEKITNSSTQAILNKWVMEKDNPKIDYIHKIIAEESEEDKDTKFIIWATNPAVIDQLVEVFSKYNPLGIHGKSHPRRVEKYAWRQEQVKLFKNSKKHKLLICNPPVLGVGLNITEARVVINLSREDDFEAVDQSLGRTHRPGMKHINMIYNLMYIDSCETAINESLINKSSTNGLLKKQGKKYLNKADVRWLLTGKR